MRKKLLILMVLINLSQSIDYMPCSEGVNAMGMALARRLITQHTPPGYRLIDYSPATQTGRNPHRWLCRFERVDNIYREDCSYLTEVRTAFRNSCPARCAISQVTISNAPAPHPKYITVEFLVTCGCTKIPRRRRYLNKQCSYGGQFMSEKSTCTGIPFGKQ